MPTPARRSGCLQDGMGATVTAPGLCRTTTWKGVRGPYEEEREGGVVESALILPAAHWEIPGKHIHLWPFRASVSVKQVALQQGGRSRVSAKKGWEPGHMVSSHP